MKLLNRITNMLRWKREPLFSSTKQNQSHSFTLDHQLTSELDHIKRASLIEAEQKGKEYGQQDTPAKDQTQLSPFEHKLKASFNKLIQKLHERVSEPIAKIDSTLRSLRDKLVYAEADEVERKGEVIDSARSDSTDARDEAEKNHSEESKQLKSRMAAVYSQTKILNQQLDLIPKEVRSRKMLLVFFALVALVVGGESWMNFLVFEFLLGEGRLATLLVTVAFSIAVAFGCHFIGKHLPLLFSKGEVGKKVALCVSILLFAVVFYILGEFRHDYILTLNPSATTMEPWQFMLLNMLLCGIMAYASYRYTRYDSEKMLERKKLEHTIEEKEKEYHQLKQKLDRVNGQHAASLSNIKSSYTREIGSVHAKSDSIRQEITALETEREELRAYARSTELEIQDEYREVVNEFRDVNFRHRPTKVIPSYWDHPLNLDLHFQDGPVGNSSHGGMVKLMTKASVILLCLGLFSCSQPEPERTKVFVPVDITDSFMVETLPTGQGLLETIGFSLEATNARSLECGFTVLSDVSANKIEYLSIDLTDTDENKFNRIARGKKFSEDLEHVISGYSQLTKGKQRSCLYRPICNMLKALQESDADHKLLIIFSDLLENSDIINLYQPEYQTRATFDDSWVKSRFDQKVPFPRCDGVDVIVVCQPNVENDRLILKVQALYRSFFEEHGAKSISFVTDI